MARDLEAVGIHSLFSEKDRNGTDRERHTLQCDLDAKDFLQKPREFRDDLLRLMRSYGVMDSYVVETRAGGHVFSPWLNSRRFMERFEETLGRKWGGDGIHRTVGWRNGGTVLRFTPKPGEGKRCICASPEPMPLSTEEPRLTFAPGCERCFGTGWTGARYVAHVRLPAESLAPWSFWSGPHLDFFAQRYSFPEATRPLQLDRRIECEALRFERYWTHRPQEATT